MKQKARRLGLVSVGGGLLLLLTIIFGARAVSESLDERRSLMESTSNRVLADAETLAHVLDSSIRLAESLLASVDLRLARSSPSSYQLILKQAAYSLPEASNLCLLDGRGRTVARAWENRISDATIAADRLDRLALTSGAECFVADSPLGPVLVVVSAIKGAALPSYAVVIFDSLFLDGRIDLARNDPNGTMSLIDSYGRVLSEVRGSPVAEALTDRPSSRPVDAASVISAQTRLPTHPLMIRVVHDLRNSMAAWQARFVSLIAIIATLLVALGSVSVAARLGARRAREAADLHEQLETRDRLFHEINHRVKNNLSTVQAILRLGEGEGVASPERATALLRSAAERIDSIVRLHEHLYSRLSIVDVDLGEYLGELAKSLREVYDVEGRIALSYRADEGLLASLDIGVPIALIVTELVTNSCKYAFPENRGGRIALDLSKDGGGAFVLEVSDDGVGIGAGTGGAGFGKTLVEGLARQLDAEILTEGRDPARPGTIWRFRVTIPAPPPVGLRGPWRAGRSRD